jgi:hypothetical protein
MSDTTNDTSLLDEKKEEETSTDTSDYGSKIGKFLISILIIIIIVLCYFGSGGLILYICKLAQSNILPTEDKCFPYTDNIPDIQKIKTNLFTTFTEPEMSVKLEFPYDEYNSSNILLDKCREYKQTPSSYFLANYLISIIESLVQFNYSIINSIMNMMNNIPEVILVLFGPIIISIIVSFNLIINLFYFVYLWFANMYWFFKTNKNDTGKGKPEWDDVTLFTPINWSLGFGLIILFTIFFFIGLPIISFIPFLALLWCMLSSVMYKGLINDKEANAFTIIKDVLKYYKISITSIISFFVILISFSTLGAVPGIFSIITVGLIYFGFISMNIFTPIEISDLTPVVNNKQAKKTCIGVVETKEKHGFLYNLILGQKGGNQNITSQLKKIKKYL